ncbi:MAG: DUF1566 domain-containing protein [Candidatus Magnetominusculus sp. LBB02]|nr:DUF1566 domain-containing protein [Candidatus Magnetominusculus sp. LBB02]
MAKRLYFIIAAVLIFISAAYGYDAELRRTGQQSSYDANRPQKDDGALKKGVAWLSPRFIDNSDGTVTDKLTGLMWTKNANLPGATKSWQGALNYAASMNTSSGTYGYTDWRLPNQEELFSLIDVSRYYPALPANHPFTNVESTADLCWYWSSTTYAGSTNVAWVVHMDDGAVNYDNKSNNTNYVWPVRGGRTAASDSSAAASAINAIYEQYASWFGTASGSLTSGTYNGITYYTQWFSNGAAIVAGYDGNLYTYYNGTWYGLSIVWKDYGKAASAINTVYAKYASWFGTKAGGLTSATYNGITYYVQWFSNGAAIVAGYDGNLYTYYNGTWYSLGVTWK